jgi:HPt (histidine-containing phosphotransfer) domain-containing protein
MNDSQTMPPLDLNDNPTRRKGLVAIRNLRLKEGLARFAGDEARYRHWLCEFINHGPTAMLQIRQAIDKGSAEAAIRLTHALKGRTGMLGMAELHSIALSLEMSLRNKEPSALWLQELESTTLEMCKEIASALQE